MEIALVITSVGLLIFLAHSFSALFEKTRIPDVLLLVFLGLIIGPATGLVRPEAFGQVGNVFTTIALVIILFESGLELSFKAIKQSMMRATRVTVINFVGTAAAVALASTYIFHLSTLEGLILGSILGATAPAVVIPLVEKLPLRKSGRTTLILESTFGEALAIVVTLGLLQGMKYTEVQPSRFLGEAIASFLLAALIGAVAAYFWSILLHRVRELENSTFTTPAFVFIIFGVTDLLGYTGAIAAFAFGIVLGNIQSKELAILKNATALEPIGLNKAEKAILGEAVFLLKTFFFVYIGLSARPTDLPFLLMAIGLTAIIFVIRTPLVYLGLERSESRLDASMAAVMAPRGLAAAVLASLLVQEGLANSTLINDIVYAVITLSIISTTILVFLIEKSALGQIYGYLFSKYEPETAANAKKSS